MAKVYEVDLLIATPISGIQFYDLVETIREALQKKVDILNHEQLNKKDSNQPSFYY